MRNIFLQLMNTVQLENVSDNHDLNRIFLSVELPYGKNADFSLWNAAVISFRGLRISLLGGISFKLADYGFILEDEGFVSADMINRSTNLTILNWVLQFTYDKYPVHFSRKFQFHFLHMLWNIA